MSRNQDLSHGSAKSSRLSLISKKRKTPLKTSPKNVEKISSYFQTLAPESEISDDPVYAEEKSCLNEEISPYKKFLTKIISQRDITNDDHDFKSPKSFLKPNTSKVSNKESKSKPQKSSKSKTKYARQPKVTSLFKTTNENFVNDDVNPEHLQMAIALSKSTFAQEYSQEPVPVEDDICSILSKGEMKSTKMKATLEQFGFKSDKPKVKIPTKRKNSKFKYLKPTLFIRTDEERMLMTDKRISAILQNNYATNFCSTEVEIEIISENLKKFVAIKSKLFHFNNTVHDSKDFYVKEMKFPPSVAKCGCFLKNWHAIQGRDISPPRKKINTEKIDVSENDLATEGNSLSNVNEFYKDLSKKSITSPIKNITDINSETTKTAFDTSPGVEENHDDSIIKKAQMNLESFNIEVNEIFFKNDSVIGNNDLSKNNKVLELGESLEDTIIYDVESELEKIKDTQFASKNAENTSNRSISPDLFESDNEYDVDFENKSISQKKDESPAKINTIATPVSTIKDLCDTTFSKAKVIDKGIENYEHFNELAPTEFYDLSISSDDENYLMEIKKLCTQENENSEQKNSPKNKSFSSNSSSISGAEKSNLFIPSDNDIQLLKSLNQKYNSSEGLDISSFKKDYKLIKITGYSQKSLEIDYKRGKPFESIVISSDEDDDYISKKTEISKESNSSSNLSNNCSKLSETVNNNLKNSFEQKEFPKKSITENVSESSGYVSSVPSSYSLKKQESNNSYISLNRDVEENIFPSNSPLKNTITEERNYDKDIKETNVKDDSLKRKITFGNLQLHQNNTFISEDQQDLEDFFLDSLEENNSEKKSGLRKHKRMSFQSQSDNSDLKRKVSFGGNKNILFDSIREPELENDESNSSVLSPYFNSDFKRKSSFGYNTTKALNVTDYIIDLLSQKDSKVEAIEKSGHDFKRNDIDNNYKINDFENEAYDLGEKIENSQSSQESILISDEELNYSSIYSSPQVSKKKGTKNNTRKNLYKLSDLEISDAEPTYNYVNKKTVINLDKIKENTSAQHSRISELKNETVCPKKSLKADFFNDSFDELLEDPNLFKKIDEFEKLTPERNNIPKATTSKNSSQQKNTPDNNVIVKTTNITPMPNYHDMNTPKLSEELEKYGLKPLKRSRAAKILKHIYENTHPLVENKQYSDTEEDVRVVKRKKTSFGRHKTVEIMETTQFVVTKKIEDNTCIVGDELLKWENLEDLVFERKQSVRMASCRVPLQIVWNNFVSNNPNIQENILLYEPLQLEVLHEMLKEQGYKFHIQDLLTFLDKKCITIRTGQGGGHQTKKRNK